MRGQLVDGRRVSPPGGLARRGKFVAGHFRPWTGTERVEDAYGGTQLLACLDTLSRSSQVRTISELRAGGLENVRRFLMQGQCGLEVTVGRVCRCDKRPAARGAGQCPWLALGRRGVRVLVGRVSSFVGAA